MQIKEILESYKDGSISLMEAESKLINKDFEDLGYAKIDTDRKNRTGEAEVVFCQNKPDEYLSKIFKTISDNDSEVLGTRASKEQYELLKKDFPNIQYDSISKVLKLEKNKPKEKLGNIVICTGGTSDIPVAEEAAQTAEFFGSKVTRVYDVGVAGIHRLLAQKETLENANVVIAIAGMEGALATVVAGLVKVPVIAVPTSVGYGASFEGLASLLSMINSCANGVTIVNIDNGYGAGYSANRINKLIVNGNK